MHLELQSSISALAILPVAEMANFLRVDDPTQMAEIGSLISAAITKFQEHTGRQIGTATYKMTLRSFPRCARAIRLPKPPTVSVSSVGYYATAGSLTTLDTAAYQVGKGEVFHWIESAASGYWPAVAPGLANGVEIVFTCGYGTARASIDDDLIHSLKVLVAHWYENREAGDLPDFIVNLWGSWYTGEQG